MGRLSAEKGRLSALMGVLSAKKGHLSALIGVLSAKKGHLSADGIYCGKLDVEIV